MGFRTNRVNLDVFLPQANDTIFVKRVLSEKNIKGYGIMRCLQFAFCPDNNFPFFQNKHRNYEI